MDMDKPGTFPLGHTVNRTHGHTWKGGHSSTYTSWMTMKRRCRPGQPYALRGIRVDPRWSSFALFLKDMGPRPDGHTLDRIDPAGNYEPGNCRWATPEVQHANKTVIGSRSCPDGCGCGRHKPTVHSAETRAKLSKAKLGHEVTQETRDKISATKRARRGD